MECGKSVSTEVPDETIVRAWLVCPECIEQMAEDGRLDLNLTGKPSGKVDEPT